MKFCLWKQSSTHDRSFSDQNFNGAEKHDFQTVLPLKTVIASYGYVMAVQALGKQHEFTMSEHPEVM